jgi:hypothetical protein
MEKEMNTGIDDDTKTHLNLKYSKKDEKKRTYCLFERGLWWDHPFSLYPFCYPCPLNTIDEGEIKRMFPETKQSYT